jgi:transcriptional regulator with XRE-family HTH domain
MDNPLIIYQFAKEDVTEQMSSFGEYIAVHRKALKLTQKDVSLQLKKEDGVPISLSYFHDIEAGKRNPPNDQIIEQLAAILQVRVELLYFQAERMPTDFKREGITRGTNTGGLRSVSAQTRCSGRVEKEFSGVGHRNRQRMRSQSADSPYYTDRLMKHAELSKHRSAIVVDSLSGQSIVSIECVYTANRQFHSSACRRKTPPSAKVCAANHDFH